jgi:hypothetical protein
LLLKNDPLPFKKTDICKLKGYDNSYRIRIGNIRIVYDVFVEAKDNIDPLCRHKRKSPQLIRAALILEAGL